MYYKIEVAKAGVNLIDKSALHFTISQLRNKNYKPIYLSHIRRFIKKRTPLKGNYYLLISKQLYGLLLKKALPLLVTEKNAIVLLLPVIVSCNSKKYHQLRVQQLNDFMFSEEFKIIFSFTQPNNQVPATIL